MPKPFSFFIITILLFFSFNKTNASELNEEIRSIVDNHVIPVAIDGFDKIGVVLLGGGFIATVVIKSYDANVDRHLSKHSLISDSTAKFGNFLAADGHILMISGLHSFLDRPNGIPHLESYLATGATVEILKNVTYRTRPNGIGHNSFPSGHVAVAFTSATALTYGYGFKAAIPAYSLASLTFLSRLQSRKHWLSDCVSGAIIGIFWARSASLHHYRILPVVTTDSVSLVATHEF